MLGPHHQTGDKPPPSFNLPEDFDHGAELDESNVRIPLNFRFRKRFGEIDWRKLSTIDVDRVARELDFATLQENISAVTFCNTDAISDIDPLVTKLFKLAQYTIEYLLHSQEYLQSVVGDLEQKIETVVVEKSSVEKQLDTANTEVKKLKIENKKRRKMIQQQQRIIEAGAASYYQCPHCDKAFMNASFLQGHLQRRHPEAAAYIGDVIQHSQKEQTKLGNKLKDLESDLQKERENFSAKLREAEEDKKRWAAASQAEMEDWKSREVERWNREVEEMKKSFNDDITKLRNKEAEYEKTIVSLRETVHQDQSNLGDLVDDFHEERSKVEAHDGKIHKLEKQLHSKNQQIKLMASDIEQMNQDHTTSLLNQKNKILSEQERRMRTLESQLKRKEIASKKSPKPSAKVKVVEPESETDKSEYEHDAAPNRGELKRKYKEQFLRVIPGIVEDNLRKCGVDPNAQGISIKTLTNKLMVLRTERQQKAKNLSNYYPQRQAVARKVDAELKRRLSEQSPPKKKKGGSSATLPKTRSGSKPGYHGNRGGSPQRAATLGRVPRSSEPPGSRDTPEKTRGERKGPKLQSTPIPAPRVESREEDEDLSSWDSIEEIIQPRQPQSTSEQPVGTSRQPVTNQDEESDWNSDIEDLLSENENNATSGTKVQQLAGSIEKQLSSRKKPPVGAVDLTPRQDEVQVLSEEDSFAVSSLEENPKPIPRGQSGVRQSVTTNSSHTLGTSVWGSGNKPDANEGSDWDEDLDLDEILT